MKSILVLFLSVSTSLFSQQLPPLSQLMKGKEFIGTWPENQYWHVDETKIIFQWNPTNNLESSWYSYSIKTKKTEKCSANSAQDLVPFDYSQTLYPDQYSIVNGDLVRFDKLSKTFVSIYSTSARVSNVKRLSNPNKVVFQIDNNLFLYSKEIGNIIQLTDIRLEDEKPEKNETNYLQDEENLLFQYVQESEASKDYRKKASTAKKGPKKIYLGKNQLDFIELSPNGEDVFLGVSTLPTNKNTEYVTYINVDGYTNTKNARPKVGELEPNMKLFHLKLTSDSIVSISFKSLTDFQKKPGYFKLYPNPTDFYIEDRLVYVHAPIFSKKGEAVFDIRSRDNKDRWLVVWRKTENKITEINHQHDEAWIGGPGIEPWDVVPGTLGWIAENQIYFQSEVTGWSHLYTYSLDKKNTTAITSGNFEIREVKLSRDQRSFYLIANRMHLGNRNYYQIDIASKKWKTIWEKTGAIQPELSPNENYIAALTSTTTQPWELSIIANGTSTTITSSESQEFKNIKLTAPEIITIEGSDGVPVYSRIYRPTGTNKNSAAVIFVHGAGYLQNAHQYWSSYYREFLFHQLLVSQGYTVLDIDYRASEGYGRDYRTAIYRHMGGMDLDDQLSGKKYLIEKEGIMPEKVGIYGGSYGGFITLMALLTKPGTFACGAALRSVTDWAHYNHEYTSNILNYPQTDPDAYKKSSPIYFAQNLSDPLILLHGMVDDNVQFQDVVRLSERFIELGKKNWDIAIYPVEAHGFVKPYSWTDEYRRILELFNTHLLKE